MSKRRIDVAVGQRYREAGRSFLGAIMPSWRVDSVFVGADALTHACLVSTADPTARKTITARTLADRQRYVLEAVEA